MVFPAKMDVLTGEVGKVLSILQAPKRCVVCRKDCSMQGVDCKIQTCSGCKIHRYCSTTCQKQHWVAGHKQLCKHASTLLSLSRLDFSKFDCFQDWKFANKKLCQEEQDRKHDLINESMISSINPSCSLANLRVFLDAIQDKVLATDPLSKEICERMGLGNNLFLDNNGEVKTKVLESGFYKPVKEHFLFKGLSDLCDKHMQDKKFKQSAVDMQKMSDEFKTDVMDQMLEGCLLEALFLAMPVWQKELEAKGLWWFFDAHDVFVFGGFDAAFGRKDGKSKGKKDEDLWVSKDGWDCKVTDRDSGLARNDRVDIRAFYSEHMGVTATLAEEAAKSYLGGGVVLRILRATGNQSYHQTVSKVHDDHATGKCLHNVFTLWIRENVTMCGYFDQPFSASEPLKPQLLAAKGNPVDLMLRNMGMRGQGRGQGS
eukprot:TRINITY_DN98538_c0_g1_i1.p1 TRINITY_DN98538_c0_g1~~TRINITY_DN98538_c0_g1_i1.p1  ORF type:complete len:460 (+),score=79.02 TRINITY_DN98538_c0_g1_i1:99-1382(+)